MSRVWLICALLLAGPAMAQDTDDPEQRAKAMFEEGGRLYEAGKYEEAVAAFKIAYELSPRPLLLYNMVSPLERLGRWDEALDALVQYADTAPEEEQQSLASRIASLEDRIAEREQTASSESEAQPDDPVVTAPQPEKKGNGLAVALFGVGAAGVGVGGVFTATTLSARKSWTGECLDGGDGMLCPSTASEAWKRDNVHGVVADVGWVVGLGGLGGGLVVSLGGRASDVQLTLAPNAVGLGGRW